MIWPVGAEELAAERQVVGPGRAKIEVINQPELAPYDLEVRVALVGGRYVVTHLEVHADRITDPDVDIKVRDLRSSTGDELFTPSSRVPPITATGLAELRLPAILLDGLSGKVKPRWRNARGEWVTGMGQGDELPMIYVLAQACGAHPTKAVAEHFGITSGAAAQRVARARKDGLLPPTTKGAR